ncbi:MAG: hypothetical protein Tsb0015_01130 [Simkaniaceae bacterium]
MVNQRQKQSLPTPQTVSWLGDWWWGSEEQEEQWVRPNTYDEIIQMLEDLESGELERRYSPMQLEKVNDYIATLAKEGILPNEFEEEYELAEDTYDLMYGEDSVFQLTRYLENSHEYMIIPAVLNGYSGYDIIQCGKISKAWKKTKKFCKKHKKAIIIGAVVVVAVTVVAVAIVSASSASAASAAAGTAGAAAGAGAGSSDFGHSESKEESPPVSAAPKETLPSVDTNEAPIMKAALDDHVASFKEFLLEDKAAQEATGSKGWDEMSFGEKAREVGANVAHKALDEVTDLVKVFPQLCEEVKELGDRFLPESLKLPASGEPVSLVENYENMVAKGHEAIDKVFSTDQAELFTAEARANDSMNNFAIGMIPLPGGIPKVFSNTNNLIKAGNAIDRAGFTKVGRGLMKHGYREGSGFPKPVGNPAQINAQGQRMLESILNHPEREYILYDSSRMGKTVDIYAPNIGGARYSLEGEFIGFLEFKK